MLLKNNDINKNKNFPLIVNQLPNNTSQINNYYINLSENLNMNNNSNNGPTHQNPINVNDILPYSNNINSNYVPTDETFLNQFINLRSFLAMFQIQSAYQQYSQLVSNINKYKENEKSLNQKDLVGNKRNREKKESRNNIINKKTNKNNKLDIIKEKNVSKIKNKKMAFGMNDSNESSKIINENIINNNSTTENNNKLAIEKKFKNAEMDLKNGKKENKKPSHSIGERKIKRFKELLQDTLLENLDRPKNDLSIIINNSRIEKTSNNPKNKTFNNKKNKKVIKGLKYDSNNDKEINENIKPSNKVYKYKNSKNNNIKYQSTECIFHGDNYEKTKSPIDFMKYNYNYNYIEEKKQKSKIIEKKAKKTVDLQKMINLNNYEKNNYNFQI